jgi:3-hydroxybutyryl-CoA dehydrogenase
MGNGIAHVFATSGHDVVMIDVSADALARGKGTIAKNLERQVKKGALEQALADAALARVHTHTSLEAVADADLVVEAATERRDLKFALFAEADGASRRTRFWPRTPAPSPSPRSPPHEAARAGHRHALHESGAGDAARGGDSRARHERRDDAAVMSLSKALGKTPVEVNDFPGFVANRILMPMINEAIYCVMEGVGTPEAIDTVMKLGMNHPMGPLTLADFIGLDTCLAIMEVLHEGLGDSKYRACPLLRKYVAAGWLGRKSGRGFYDYRAAA